MYDKLYKTDLCSRRLDSCTLSCSSLLCSSASLLYVYTTAAAADTPPPTAAVADLPLSSAANLDRALQCHHHYHGYNQSEHSDFDGPASGAYKVCNSRNSV